MCNGLPGTVGYAQARGSGQEPALMTAGNDVAGIVRFLPPGADSYTAADVIRCLLEGVEDAPEPVASPAPEPAMAV